MARNTITTSNNSGTVLTTATNWAATSTNTAYVPNIGNQFIYDTTPTPFNISFNWEGKSVTVTLKDGNDIFRLANVFMEWLDTNKIEYNVKTKGKRKKK